MTEVMKPDREKEAEEENIEQLRNALCAIAYEVQSFNTSQGSQINVNDSDNEESTCKDEAGLESCKIKLEAKRKIIHSLKENLKTACTIAKTALAVKESDTSSYNNTLEKAKLQSACLVLKNTEFNGQLQKLTRENQILNNQIKNLQKFIELGFQELQKMRKETPEELPTLMQLKKIILCCGQYFADFTNEHDKCLRLEQKNRYLNNKLAILENSLEGVTQELKKLKNQKSCKKGSKIKADYNSSQTIGYVSSSEHRFGPSNKAARTSTTSTSLPAKTADSKCIPDRDLDLSSHLSLVKNLLNDQDTMLQDLRQLSKKNKVSEAMCSSSDPDKDVDSVAAPELDVASCRRAFQCLAKVPSEYYSSALVTALTTLAENMEIDLRITKTMSTDDIVNCFVIAFEVPDLGSSDYLEIALPALCHASEHLPVKGNYELNKSQYGREAKKLPGHPENSYFRPIYYGRKFDDV